MIRLIPPGSRLRLILVWLALAALPGQGFGLDSSQGRLNVAPVVQGLDQPWGLAFLPDGGVLVTERGGDLLLVRQGRAQKLGGLPAVAAKGQGGLLDVMVPGDFARSREIFLTFSKRQGGGAGTALARARLAPGAKRLSDVKLLFEAAPNSSGGRHFGSRVIEAPDGTLYLTLGERGQRDSAQDLSLHQGSVIRLNRDGSVPGDNPFVGRAGARPEIWTYGHRNPQGMAVDSRGRIWVAEHGAKGGDEINLLRKGANYGWPVISYGRHYSGARIGEGTHKQGMEQPEFYWDPSIAPSGMMIYSGRLWPEWTGDIFVGSLKFDYISRLSGSKLTEREQLKSPETARVRDVREAPDGSIWFISVGNGTVYRIAPGS